MSKQPGYKLNKQDPIERAKEIHGDLYDYSRFQYVTMHTISLVICKVHGPFERSMSDHLYRKCGCPKCKDEKIISSRTGTYARWSTSKFIEVATHQFGNVYDYSNVVYNNMHTYVEVNCIKHGPWLVTPANHLYNGKFGSGCPKCNPKMSSPERYIMSILDTSNITYHYQYTFDGLFSDKGKSLYYDFYLPNQNMLIEYDGQQHFIEVPIHQSRSLERIQYLDKIKDGYAAAHNIHLKRLPYWLKKKQLTSMVHQSITSGQ